MSDGLQIRTGTVRRDRRGRETGVVWDVDLSRLWDGVALWVALGQLETVGIWRLNPAGPAVPWILVPR